MSENDTAVKNGVKYFWSPSARWTQHGQSLKIEMFIYKNQYITLFPDFYWFTQNGITLDQLFDKFGNFDQVLLQRFVLDLIKKRILVNTFLSPAELFYPQNFLFENKYAETIKINAKELEDFRDKQLNRKLNDNARDFIQITPDENIPSILKNRRTCREFDTTELITARDFSSILTILGTKSDGKLFYYASAGGLYPLDLYIYVKQNRVEGVSKGLYIFQPVERRLYLINDTCEITRDAHYFNNKDIFSTSAFSLFLIYNGEANMPKYGGMGYLFACIDSGVLVGALTVIAEHLSMGLCSIGDLNFHSIEPFFNLNKNQTFIHAIEIGLKKKP